MSYGYQKHNNMQIYHSVPHKYALSFSKDIQMNLMGLTKLYLFFFD